ncbi:uncharacterized protein LOC113367735 [Ctenocephalides felis]|uniref:uncharacterized protein LOC113367735 n=1 Tax=Ctenocephalides felis TaxID=7515 RepID=UPI000E6E4E51|nr:uncharacterized protein LOC113367735 [Ctenocephalides felis]
MSYNNGYRLNGRACMLRAICEGSENPFTHENGILGELMHIILTPSTTNEALSEHSDNEYLMAEKIGREAQKDHENGHVIGTSIQGLKLTTEKVHLIATQAIFGVGLPVVLKDQSVTVGSVMKANYKLQYLTDTPVGNLSYHQLFDDDNSRSGDGISKRDVDGRENMSLTRWHVYRSIEMLVNSYGLQGKECMLRAICENAENPFTHENGLLGELMHIILTPSTTNEAVNQHSDNEYISAEKIGREAQRDFEYGQERCSRVFHDCAMPLLQIFSNAEYLWKNSKTRQY